jgi:predicted nucleic acid-binding protein
MILLDTNVVSEGLRARPSPHVRDWLDALPAGELFLCTPVLAELHYGVELLPASVRRTKLERSIADLIDAFADRVLPFDTVAALEYGKFVARRDSVGRATGTMDGLIAAIAMAHGATIATRDVRGFDDAGVSLIDPFNLTSQRR